MSWVEKQYQTTFETSKLPIHGLMFLDGDILARMFGHRFLEGQKYPQVSFPSGLSFEIWESNPEHGGIIHVYGEMDLPYFSTRDEAWERADTIAETMGYRTRKRGEDQLEVIGHDAEEHYLITYNNHERRMDDIARIKPSPHERLAERQPLLDQKSRELLPRLYTNEAAGIEAFAQVKFFTPSSNWTWYASEASAIMRDGTYKALTEVDPNDPNIEDVIFFGLVDGYDLEFGYFSLSELESVGGGLTLPIERDRHFTPISLKELRDHHRKNRLGDNK